METNRLVCTVPNIPPVRREIRRRASAYRWSVTRLDLAPTYPGAFCLSGCDARPMHFEQDPFSARVKTSLTFVVRNLR
jgi:hypothetical protein